MFKNMPKHKIIPLVCAGLLFVLGISLINVNSIVGAQDNLSLIVGVSILVVGVVRLIYGIVLVTKQRDSLYNIIFGGVDLIFGIVFLVYIHDKLVFMVVLSIYIVIEAVLDIVGAISKSYVEIPWVGALIVGIIKFIFGVLIMFKPFGGFNFWVIFAGIYFMLQCASWILFTLKIKETPQNQSNIEKNIDK